MSSTTISLLADPTADRYSITRSPIALVGWPESATTSALTTSSAPNTDYPETAEPWEDIWAVLAVVVLGIAVSIILFIGYLFIRAKVRAIRDQRDRRLRAET
ncbi:hypothetical protein HO173_009594 [Letharia columbiana]|uniref:Uncharacterized protein n=1 Tax=Letharia columbiana TaxID=112416 RepID=A0A8H6FP97_9LECA|nr:uncharacterized protein HO173_009594 [Letharia columbiana]KAF6232211.1 hypothetical protein HO173_009594 [Letharia columbiana]